MAKRSSAVSAETIKRRIHIVRDQKIMLDEDLARLYGVETRALVQAVQRNRTRFPDDFMFQLSQDESITLRSQSVISNGGRVGSGRGGRRYRPYAFTEQGVAMLSSVLRSERAVQVNIAIMRAFVRLRAMASTSTELERKIHALERKYDAQFKTVFDAIRQLMEPPDRPKPTIGFRAES